MKALVWQIPLAIVIGLVLLFLNGGFNRGRPHFPHSTLSITRADGKKFDFDVELALTPKEQAYGLMFIKSLDPGAGMIFPYNPPQEVAFWMENTLIPLDMLFVATDGTIGRIVADARPGDVTPIYSQQPVVAVIEIGGGMAKKDGLAVGDKVASPAIRPIGGVPAP